MITNSIKLNLKKVTKTIGKCIAYVLISWSLNFQKIIFILKLKGDFFQNKYFPMEIETNVLTKREVKYFLVISLKLPVKLFFFLTNATFDFLRTGGFLYVDTHLWRLLSSIRSDMLTRPDIH